MVACSVCWRAGAVRLPVASTEKWSTRRAAICVGDSTLERAAASGDPGRFALPRPMLGRPNADFSFSGLKPALRQAAAERELDDQAKADLAASFQAAIADVLVDRTRRAIDMFEERHGGGRPLVVAEYDADLHPWQLPLRDAALAARPDAVRIHTGLPAGPGDFCTFGRGRANLRAAAEVLTRAATPSGA